MANAAGSGGKSAARLKRRNESKMIMRQPIMLISILTVIVLLLLFVIYPLVKILLFSLTDASGTFSLATAAEIFSTSRYLKTFGRTMVLGVIVAVIATFIGYIFAYTITRTNVPCKGFLKTIATLPILSPPFILCLSIIFLFGRQGLITNGLLKITDNDVYGMGSLIVVQVLSFFPIAYMTLSGILSSIDASVEDAACNMGTPSGRSPFRCPCRASSPAACWCSSSLWRTSPIPPPSAAISPPYLWKSIKPSPAAMTCRRAPCWRF